jgi:hypothetical protein
MDVEGATMQIVNGYVCQTGCDVAAAKRGHDPKNPRDDPVKAEMLARAKGLPPPDKTADARTLAADGLSTNAVSFGGTLSRVIPSAIAVPVASRLVDRLA